MAFGKSVLKGSVIAAALATTAAAQTLPLPDNLINLDSSKGSALLQESEALQSYWPLSIQFVTQKNQAFCGVASIVMVLNALGIPAPTTPEFEPYRTFTQENVFTPATESILPQATLLKMGMTLDQIGAFIATYIIKVVGFGAALFVIGTPDWLERTWFFIAAVAAVVVWQAAEVFAFSRTRHQLYADPEPEDGQQRNGGSGDGS